MVVEGRNIGCADERAVEAWVEALTDRFDEPIACGVASHRILDETITRPDDALFGEGVLFAGSNGCDGGETKWRSSSQRCGGSGPTRVGPRIRQSSRSSGESGRAPESVSRRSRKRRCTWLSVSSQGQGLPVAGGHIDLPAHPVEQIGPRGVPGLIVGQQRLEPIHQRERSRGAFGTCVRFARDKTSGVLDEPAEHQHVDHSEERLVRAPRELVEVVAGEHEHREAGVLHGTTSLGEGADLCELERFRARNASK